MLDISFPIKLNIEDKAGGVIAIVIMLAVMSLFKCFGSTRNNIIGIWKRTDTEMVYEFTKDGHIYLNGNNYGSITFTNNEKRIKIDIDMFWSHTRLFADVDYYENTIKLSNFTDQDDLFGVEDNDTWVFEKIY